MASRSQRVTTADAVVLSLLCEQPMHGYHLNQELERRQVRDWAAISRAQIYYSLDKLHREGWIEETADYEDVAAGPERQKFTTTKAGRAVLAEALARESWATERERPTFLTWLALSMHTSAEAVQAVVARRRTYLEAELTRERETLCGILADTPRIVPEAYFDSTRTRAVLMVELLIEHFEIELRWLKRVEERLGLPPYTQVER